MHKESLSPPVVKHARVRPLGCVSRLLLWCRRAGPTPARSSARNCWSWSGGWPRTTRTAWWPTRSSTCCGTWRTATTCPWTSWTRRSVLTSRSWITAAPRYGTRRVDWLRLTRRCHCLTFSLFLLSLATGQRHAEDPVDRSLYRGAPNQWQMGDPCTETDPRNL